MLPNFRLINPKTERLEERIRSLEAVNEGLTSELNTIREELNRVRNERDDFLHRLFELSGIERKERIETQSTSPQQIGKIQIPWTRQRQILEQQSKDEYWKKKAAEVERMEKDLGIESKEETGS